MTTRALRQALIDARHEALRSLLARRSLSQHPGIASASGPVLAIAVGKGAPNMLRECASLLGDQIDRSLVITTDSTDVGALPARTRLLRASHPVPDARSLDAAEEALAFASSARSDGTLVVLVSGGASALVCAPPPGMSFESKRGLVDELLRSGAPIHHVNTVRRHLSRIKGGALAAASRARVACAIASDVINGQPHDVGSGPACVDPTSRQDAADVLAQTLGNERLRDLLPFLTHGLSATDDAASRVDARIVLGPEHLAQAVADALSHRGFLARPCLLASCSAESLAVELVRRASQLGRGEAIVLAAEPTLRLPPTRGRGGRAGWVALRVLAEPGLRDDVALLCASSDGVDGSSGSAGACVASDVACDVGELRLALARFDDAQSHQSMGTQLAGGPTGLNLTDVYVCARSPA